MPELPEVETVRRTLLPFVLGQAIAGLRAGDFPGVMNEPIEQVSPRVAGRVIEGIDRRGKFLMLRLDDGCVLQVHLRMTGAMLALPNAASPVRFERLVIELANGTDLRFADQRKFGRVLHLTSVELLRFAGTMGVEPLTGSFTAERLAKVVHGRSRPIKNILLDQHLLAGIGNIYADEALFRAGIHPARAGGTLTPPEIARLHRAIRVVLREAIERNGTTFSDFQNAHGDAGDNAENLRVYGRGQKRLPCFRCGQPIARIVLGQRSTCFCPRCQPPPSIEELPR